MEWRTVAEFPLYSISEDGQLRRTGKGRFGPSDKPIGGWLDAHGYRSFTFWRPDGRKVNRKRCHLVALAFVGPRLSMKHEICHADSDRTNDQWRNVRWGTRTENEADKRIVGRDNSGERHGHAKLTADKVREIIDLYRAGGVTQLELGAQFGVHQVQVSQIVRGKAWGYALERTEKSPAT